MLLEKLRPVYDKYCDYVARGTKGAEIIIYGTAGALFTFAYIRMRPITKFGSPADIPKRFLQNRLIQKGTIVGVRSSPIRETILLVEHKPLLNLFPFIKKQLPVKLYRTDVNPNGFSWLETITVNNKIEFRPITKNPDNVECQVILICPNNKKHRLDLSEALISIGFGKLQLEKEPISDPILKRYNHYLEYVEKQAKKHRQGVWSQNMPVVSWPVKLIHRLSEWLESRILPAHRRLPELVR